MVVQAQAWVRADEPEFFSVGVEVPHRPSLLGLVLLHLVEVEVEGLLLLLVVVEVEELLLREMVEELQ